MRRDVILEIINGIAVDPQFTGNLVISEDKFDLLADSIDDYIDDLMLKYRKLVLDRIPEVLTDISKEREQKDICKCENNSWSRVAGGFVCDDCGKLI